MTYMIFFELFLSLTVRSVTLLCDTVWSGKPLLISWKNYLSDLQDTSFKPWGNKSRISSKYWYRPTRLHCVITEKTRVIYCALPSGNKMAVNWTLLKQVYCFLIIYRYTGTLFYLITRLTIYSESFAWRQTAQRSLLFQVAVRRGPRSSF